MITEKDAEIGKLNAKVQQNEELANKKEKLEQEITEHKNCILVLKTNIKDVEGKNNKLENNIKEIEAKLVESKELHEKNNKNKERIISKQTEALEESKQEYIKYKKEQEKYISESEMRFKSAVTNNEKLENEKIALLNSINSQKLEINTYIENNKGLKNQQKVVENENLYLKKEVDIFYSGLNKYKDKIINIKVLYKGVLKLYEEFTNEFKHELKRRINRIQEKVSLLEQSTINEIKKLEQEKIKNLQNIQALEKDLTVEKEKVGLKEKEINELNIKQTAGRKKSEADPNNENKKLKLKLEKVEEELNVTKRNLQAAQEKLSKIQEIKKPNTKAQSLEELKAKLAEKEAALNDLEIKCTNFQENDKVKEDKILLFENILEENEKTISNLNQEIEKLKSSQPADPSIVAIKEIKDVNAKEEIRTYISEVLFIYKTLESVGKELLIAVTEKQERAKSFINFAEDIAKKPKKDAQILALKNLKDFDLPYVKAIPLKTDNLKFLIPCITESSKIKIQKLGKYEEDIAKFDGLVKVSQGKMPIFESRLSAFDEASK